jgi:hypothetical protein
MGHPTFVAGEERWSSQHPPIKELTTSGILQSASKSSSRKILPRTMRVILESSTTSALPILHAPLLPGGLVREPVQVNEAVLKDPGQRSTARVYYRL